MYARYKALFAIKNSYLYSCLMPGSLQTLVSILVFLVFCDVSCVIFFTMVSVCKARQARQARLLKTVNKHFYNFIGQNQQKRKWDEKPITIKSR